MSLFGSFWKKSSGNSTEGQWKVGDKIFDVFEVRRIAGGKDKSGMGIVYICYAKRHNTYFALKTFQERFLLSEEVQELFAREAHIWVELGQFLNIVQAYWVWKGDRGKEKDRLFVILEYIPPDTHGRNTLTPYLGSLTIPDILNFSIQFCDGMEYAYSKGVNAHRDIKPDNIMITPDKIVKITDFGLAKAFQEIQLKEDIVSKGKGHSLSVFHSKGKRICGTLPYMAPEQFDGHADKRSDIYAFGISLYQMVTGGRLPFVGRTQQEYERLHKERDIPRLSSPLFPIIQKCLKKEPARRYENFAVVKEELQSLLLEETGRAMPSPEMPKLSVGYVINKANSLLNLKKFREALITIDEAIEMDSGNALAWSTKGLILYFLERYHDALQSLDEALKIDPGFVKARQLKQAIAKKLGRQDMSTSENSSDKIDGDVARWAKKGIEYIGYDKYEEALSCFDKALAIDAGNAASWVGKGLALNGLTRYQEALACCDKAIEINPRMPEAWSGKGYTLFELKRYDEACKFTEEALKINPGSAITREQLRLILQQLGR